MKLHLPKLLRNSVLACITAVAGIATTTVGTATFVGGSLAFVLAAPQAQAAYTWTGNAGDNSWDNSANWDTEFSGTGPGRPDSNMWDEIIVSNAAISGDLVLEGWANKYNFSGTTLSAKLKKIQSPSSPGWIKATNGTDIDFIISTNGFNFVGEQTFLVDSTSSLSFDLQDNGPGNNNNATLTIQLDKGGQLSFAANTERTLGGSTTLVSDVLEGVTDAWGSQALGLTLQKVTLNNLTLDLGEGWTKTDTAITAENYSTMGGMYNLIQGDDGQYSVVYSNAAVPVWTGGALSWGTGTSFSNSVSYANGQPVKFTTADATVTLAADITANTITVDENIKVGISGEHTLAANSVKLGAGAQLSIGQTNGVNLGAVAMGEGAQLNIATGTETTIADALGSTTWSGGAIGVTNGTTLNVAGTELNATAVVVDSATINTGEAYFAKDVTLKNNAVLNYTGSTSELFNWGQNQTLSVLSGSRMELGTRRISLEGTDRLILNDGHINGAGENETSLVDICKSTIGITSDGTSSIEGPIRITGASTATFVVNSGTLTVGEIKENSAGPASLSKDGAGAMKITGGTNNTGSITVSAGELILASTANTGKGAITIGETGTLTIAAGAAQNIGSSIVSNGILNLNGSIVIDPASYQVVTEGASVLSDGANGYAMGLIVACGGTFNLGENASIVVGSGETQQTYGRDDITVSGGAIAVGEADTSTYHVYTTVDMGDSYKDMSGKTISVTPDATLVLSGTEAHTVESIDNKGTTTISVDTTLGHLFSDAGTQFTVTNGAEVTLTGRDDRSIKGNLTVSGEGSKLIIATENNSDHIIYGGSASQSINVEDNGEINIGSNRWTVSGNTTINLNNGKISGSGQQGHLYVLDYIGNATIVSDGTSEISGSVRINRDMTLTATVNSGTLTLSGTTTSSHDGATLKKDGAGTLVLKQGFNLGKGLNIVAGAVQVGADLTIGGRSSGDGAPATSTLKNLSILEGGSLTTKENITINLGSTIAGAAGTTVTLGAGNTIAVASLDDLSRSNVTGKNGLGNARYDFISGSTVTLNGATVKVGEEVQTASTEGGGLYVQAVDTTTYWVVEADKPVTWSSSDTAMSGAANFYVGSEGTLNIGADSSFNKNVTNEGTLNLVGGTDYLNKVTNKATGTVNIVTEAGAGIVTLGGAIEAGSVLNLTIDAANKTVTGGAESTYIGDIIIKEGYTLVGATGDGDGQCFGQDQHKGNGETQNVADRYLVVENGAYLDFAGTPLYYQVKLKEGGTILNSGVDTGSGSRCFPKLVLEGDATIANDNAIRMIGSGYGPTSLDFGGHTLTKSGAGTFYLRNTTGTAGTLDIQSGAVEFTGEKVNLSATDVKVAENASLIIDTNESNVSEVKSVNGAGTLFMRNAGYVTITGEGTNEIGTIRIGGAADNSARVNLGEKATLKATNMQQGTMWLGGTGTYDIGSALTLTNTTLSQDWNGTVKVVNGQVTSTTDLSGLCANESSLAISGLTVADGAALTLGGKVSLGGTVSVAESIVANGTLTFGSDLKLSVAADMITNGTGNGEKVITLITGAGASAVGGMSSAMLSDDLLALGVADSWVFNADGTISFTSVNVNPKLVWGGGDGNLSDSSKYANGATYEAGSDITFGAVTDGNADTITVAASDSIANATVQTGGNYVFTGSKLNVTGNLSIATGAAVDAQAGLSVGGSLESAGTLKATTIDGAGNVSITGGSLELSGSLANTGTKSISGAELKGNWSATGVSLGTGVTVGEGGTIILTDTTLAGTVTNKGNLTLKGTVNISPSAGFQTQVSGVQYSDGANGIKYADVTYTIVTGAGTTTVDNATWQVDGVAKGTYADGKLNVKGAQQGTLYWANSGDVTYTGNMTGATGIALNGGNVALNASLADSMTDGIQVSKAGTVTLGSDATLAATQVNGATAANKVTLDGTGTYDLGSDTTLGAGIGLADSWQGTVQVDAASVTAGADLSALGNASSTIGIDGALTLGTAETAATLNAGSSALALESLTMGNVASSITAGSLVLGDSFALNLTDVLKATQEIAGNTLITLTTALSDADKDKLTGTWKGTGVAGLYDYETSWQDNALVLTGKQNAIIWEGKTESGEGGDESVFGGSEQTWDSNTTGTGDNVAFTGNCAGGDGVVNVVGDDTTGAVKVDSVTVTDIESTGTSYTFMGDSINAAGNLVVGTVDDAEVETKGNLTVSNNSTFEGAATVTESSSLAVSGVTTTDDDGNSTTTEASLTVGSLTAAGSVSVGDSGSLTVTGDLTVKESSEEEGTKGGSLSISTAGSLAAGVTTTTDAEGNTTQAATGKLSVDKITITGTLQDNAATLVTVGNLEKDVVIDLEDDSTLKDIKAGTFNLMSVLGTVTEVTLDADDLQAILAKGLGCNGLSSTGGATTFSLRRTLAPVPTDIYLEVRELTPDELIWDTNDDSSTGGLNIVDKVNDDGSIVLKDNSILDTIQTVDVEQNTTIDLSSTDDTDTVNINGLGGKANLTIVGNGDDVKVTTDVKQDNGTLAAGKHDGALVLSGVHAEVSGQYGNIPAALGSGTLVKNGVQVGEAATAELDVKDSKVVLDGGSLSGDSAMERGVLVVMSSNAAIVEGNIEVETGDSLSIDDTGIAIVGEATDSMVLDVQGTGKHVIADLGNVDGDAGDVAIVDEQNKSIAVMDKYFSGVRLEGGKVVADRNTSYYSDKAGESVSANGAAGLAMADAVLVELNPQAAKVKGGLAAVLDALDTATGSAADELGASLAGASTAVLGMAVSGDVDRQLQAIRNRTTTMGVDQSVANEDMPYFNAWINAEGDRSELSESGTEGGYELSSWGGTVGFDVDITPTFTAGMALTAMYGDIDTTGADKASGNIDTYYVTAFARYAPSAWTHTFVATVGMSDISLDRHVAGEETKGETDGLSFGLMYEVGRVFALTEDGSTCLQPVFNVTWKHTAIDAYTEDGSDLALEVDEQTLDTVTFGLGARLQTVVGESMYNRTSILEARVLAKADVGDRSGSSDVAFSALPGAKASVDSAEMGAFGLEAGAGLTIPVGDEGGSIFMDASVELRSDYTNVNGTVGYRINF